MCKYSTLKFCAMVVKKEDEHGMQRIKQRKFGSAAHIQKL